MRAILVGALLSGLVACGHDTLYAPATSTAKPPLRSGSMHQVTFSLANDLQPSWSPDGLRILYAFDGSEGLYPDRCVATLPPEGGTREPLSCLHRAASDSVDLSEWLAGSSAGRYVYTWSPWAHSAYTPDSSILRIGRLSDPFAERSVLTLPILLSGRVYHLVTHLTWLDDSVVVGVGTTVTIHQDCGLCPYYSVQIERDVVRITLAGDSATLAIVPGTDSATSVARGATPDEVYYTVRGDSLVYRKTLSSGSTAVAHDFGSAGIARDVQVVGTRLVAIVGGSVAVLPNPFVGGVQRDSGGPIHTVNLTSGADSVLPDSGFLFRHPALAPAGDRLVVEAWKSGRADLWFFRLP
jgi:hypothetical protein